MGWAAVFHWDSRAADGPFVAPSHPLEQRILGVGGGAQGKRSLREGAHSLRRFPHQLTFDAVGVTSGNKNGTRGCRFV